MPASCLAASRICCYCSSSSYINLNIVIGNEQWIIRLLLPELLKLEILVHVQTLHLQTWWRTRLCTSVFHAPRNVACAYACTQRCASACTSYCSLLFHLTLSYHINRGQLHYYLQWRRPWDKWYWADNKRRNKKSKVFWNLTQMCTKLNRCVYREDHVENIYF